MLLTPCHALQDLVAQGSSLGVRMELLQTASNLQAIAQSWQEDASLACDLDAEPADIEQVSSQSFQ